MALLGLFGGGGKHPNLDHIAQALPFVAHEGVELGGRVTCGHSAGAQHLFFHVRLVHDLRDGIREQLNHVPRRSRRGNDPPRLCDVIPGHCFSDSRKIRQAGAAGRTRAREGTYAAVKDAVDVRQLGEVKVKGKSRPVVIYELLALTTTPGGVASG